MKPEWIKEIVSDIEHNINAYTQELKGILDRLNPDHKLKISGTQLIESFGERVILLEERIKNFNGLLEQVRALESNGTLNEESLKNVLVHKMKRTVESIEDASWLPNSTSAFFNLSRAYKAKATVELIGFLRYCLKEEGMS